ncbi:MAG: large conductance mechanosensitive channel protein MscL [Alphaproteobacteria bacterium]|nr:large conductance mechanosensitive channel protein MscL [Alphaproteobacteria bacterium]
MFNEFKNFIARGNVMDMAVGIIIGAAFTAIVNSMVGDVIMPVIGVVTAGIDFSSLFVALDGATYATLAEAEEAGATVIKYGLFINAVINFLIVAFVIFMLVKQINNLKKKEAEKPSAPAADIKLLTEIRDLLKK